MARIYKCLAFTCALGVAGCAQGISPSQSGTLPQGVHRASSSGGPEIYVFQGTPDAAYPRVGVVNVGNTLYGTTSSGGADNLGAVYSVTTGGMETVMHSFSGGADGENPASPLTNANGTLYGTTPAQGKNQGGTLFSLTPAGTYEVVYNFGATSNDCTQPDAAMTYVPSKNALYGTASGGGANGDGCIFKIDLASKKPKESIVYSFSGSSSSPAGASGPVFYGGSLYVTTPSGGDQRNGAVLKVTLSGHESLIYSFKGSPDGSNPEAALVVVGKALYGDTAVGGTGSCIASAGCGTVFSVTPSGRESVIYRFGSVPSRLDAAVPDDALIAVGNTLYGTTSSCTGPDCSAGTLFAVTTGGDENVVYRFALNNPPGSPESPFGSVLSLNGALYGTTEESNVSGAGTVYAIPQ
jgi:uncharacterized repeat protein (TIGR03803 family)